MLTWTVLKRALHAGAVLAILGTFASPVPAAQPPAAHDLTPYQTMAKDALKLVAAGDMAGASKKVGELEAKWDSEDLRTPFPDIDGQMDVVKDAVGSHDAKKATTELNSYLQMLEKASKPPAH